MQVSIPTLVLVTMCAGCASSINVQRVESKPGPAGVPTGVPWNLAMTQYTVTITRQVTSCTGSLNGTVSVSAVAGKRLDEDQQYALSSSGVWATADITSTLAPDGTSMALNGHSEDQTAAVISNTVGFLAAIATGRAAAQGAQLRCADAVNKALSNIKGDGKASLKQKVDRGTRQVAQLTAKVTQLTTLYSAGGTKNTADRSALAKAMAELAQAQQFLTEDQALLTASLKVITDTQTVVWPSTARESFTDAALELDQSVAQSWVKWTNIPTGSDGRKLPDPPVPTDAFNVWLALYRDDGVHGWTTPTAAPQVGDVKIGVPVRLPRIGRLMACTGNPCERRIPRNWVADERHTQLITPDAAVLQFGQLYNVPITGGTFKSEGAVISLDANGVPTSIQVYEKAAAAAAATGVAQSTAPTLADLPAKIAAAKLARTQAALNQVKAENDLAAARAASTTAGETAAANAQLSYINARNSLATANANAQAAGDLGALAAQTALAQQQLALQEKQDALATAKASAAVAPAVDTLQASTTLVNAKATNINAQLALMKAEQAVAR